MSQEAVHSLSPSETAPPPRAGLSAPTAESGKVTMETRFGTFEFDRAAAIDMPRGLPGFPGHHAFGLADLGQLGQGGFMLLQSLDDASVSFLLLPYETGLGLIAEQDIDQALSLSESAPESIVILLIVTIRRIDNSTSVTANLRAPVFVDVETRTAWQHVFHNNLYDVRHPLTASETQETPA